MPVAPRPRPRGRRWTCEWSASRRPRPSSPRAVPSPTTSTGRRRWLASSCRRPRRRGSTSSASITAQTTLPGSPPTPTRKGATYTFNIDANAAGAAASIHPQAVGWWILASLAALAALAVVGQAVGRQSVVEGEEYPTLAGLGFLPPQLVALAAARNAIVAGIGALGALAIAVALSPLTPVGEARLAEPTTGISFDPLVLGPRRAGHRRDRAPPRPVAGGAGGEVPRP